jgi:hypothetical protein
MGVTHTDKPRPWYHLTPGSKRRLYGLAAVLVVLVSILIWLSIDDTSNNHSATLPVNQPASEWLNIGGEPRAYNISQRSFDLWELYADDSVRFINLYYDSNGAGHDKWFWGPSLRPGDNVLSFKTINGQLISQETYEEEYRGNSYYYIGYVVRASQNESGIEMLLRPPHLHIRETDRLISIGIDPQTKYAQDIIAVAIPSSANITRIYDYQPYRHITIDEWDVFYYDVTFIQGHVSIHISYVPSGNASPLDWTEVEASR